MKVNKFIAFLLALVVVLVFFGGCGNDNVTDLETTEKSTSQTTDGTTEVKTENKTENTDSTLQHRSWIYKIDDKNFITVSADYSADTSLVETFSFHMEIDKNYPDYEIMKNELQTYKFLIDRENDPESIEYSYKENDDGSIVFDSHFYNLCADDRASRAILILRFTGVGYNNHDEYLYYIDDMAEQLEEHEFSMQ